MADGQDYDFPTYLLDVYESISAKLALYDETSDGRQLLRALNVGCEGLQRLAADSSFWDLLADHQASSDGLREPDDLDDWLGELLGAERHLLTQAGMAPRAVALLLNEVELYVRARDQGQDMPPTTQLQSAIGALADATCEEWTRLRPFLQPSSPPPSAPPPLPLEDMPRRLGPFVGRVVKVVGGSVFVALDLIAGAHGFPPELTGYSVQIGGGMIWTGARR